MAKISEKPAGIAPVKAAAGRPPAQARPSRPASEYPPEGPHARPDLINESATPGTGLFSDKAGRNNDDEADPGAG